MNDHLTMEVFSHGVGACKGFYLQILLCFGWWYVKIKTVHLTSHSKSGTGSISQISPYSIRPLEEYVSDGDGFVSVSDILKLSQAINGADGPTVWRRG